MARWNRSGISAFTSSVESFDELVTTKRENEAVLKVD